MKFGAVGSKIVNQKMQRKERLRHLSRLQEIRLKPSAFLPQEQPTLKTNPPPDPEKNLEIERTNIALFNRIASIIKQKPRPQLAKSRTFVKSLDSALGRQQRKQIELRAKFEAYARRVNEQQPTIRNDFIARDHIRHEKYLNMIGRYPPQPHRRTHTQLDIPNPVQCQQVFHQTTLDFEIRITADSSQATYLFKVKDLVSNKEYSLTMPAQQFRQQLMNCGLSYHKLVGRLRMDKNGSMTYDVKEEHPSTSKL